MATVRIPTPLRNLTQGRQEIQAPGATVGEVLRELERTCPGLSARLFDEQGRVRRYINIFHNDEDIRFLQELSTPVAQGDRITLIPAIAGG